MDQLEFNVRAMQLYAEAMEANLIDGTRVIAVLQATFGGGRYEAATAQVAQSLAPLTAIGNAAGPPQPAQQKQRAK